MTYTVAGGMLNPTHSLRNHEVELFNFWVTMGVKYIAICRVLLDVFS